MTGREAISQLDQKHATDVSLRTKVQQAKLDEAKIPSAMPLQYNKELDLQAQTRLQKRGEGKTLRVLRPATGGPEPWRPAAACSSRAASVPLSRADASGSSRRSVPSSRRRA
ncbi:hypothetical protein [Singulisphaera sp. PoT]|uniref:hypothetical protein n=1 Tax=Singulisphaera sp. PoT TaxID=3411797 RepID=UPI003BF4CE86